MHVTMCVDHREGGWWGGWLQQSYQVIKDRVSIQCGLKGPAHLGHFLLSALI